MTRVLVTGGSGFLGSFVVERLLDRGHDPIVADVRDPRWTPGVPWIDMDVTDGASVRDTFEEAGPEAVVHLAGLLGTSETFDHPHRTVHTNVVGTLNVLEACRTDGRRFIGVETGTPWLSPYAISKRAARDFARSYHQTFGVPVTVLKVFNAFGPRQDGTGDVTKIVPRFAVNAIRGEPLPVFGDGSQVIDLVHAEGCAESFVRAVERAPGRGEVIEVGSGEPISVLAVARQILDLVGGGGDVRFLPPRIGEGDERPVADTRAARDLLGYAPSAELHRIAETVEWYRDHVVAEELLPPA